ncbi:TA system antitoxin ParD family protein [Candidatus Poriferisocius sp.]|uniref:TA system antitoxin ParD family protein n=1 Tax=Candidatus Poriferisocius sp. TaxID=3101276 RepID=UPI003B0153BD
MALSNPIRIDDGIYASAKAVAPAMDRSAAQQVSHWARIGREMERSREIPHREIAAVLNGEARFDDLDDPRAQAIVRASWAEQMKQWRETLDLEAEFIAKGLPYAELNESGEVVVHDPADPTLASRR